MTRLLATSNAPTDVIYEGAESTEATRPNQFGGLGIPVKSYHLKKVDNG
jgi:hypothetical protein